MRGGFWGNTSCSHASSNAIKSTGKVVAELIPHVLSCSDFLFSIPFKSYVVGRHGSGSSLGTGAIYA